MTNISDDLFKQIQEKICRPEGTVTFEYFSEVLFDQNAPGVLFEVPSGAHLFRVEKNDTFQLSFYHSSPGTGTRVATIDLKEVMPSSKVFLAFSWKPEEIQLHIGPKIAGGQLVSAKGSSSPIQFRVGAHGSIFQIGDLGISVMDFSMYQNGELVLSPTALEAWRHTVEAVKILSSGSSEEGYIFEVVTANLSLSILVTGFEAYCHTRFLEIEQEGIKPNMEALIMKFFSQKERDADLPNIQKNESEHENITFLKKIAKKRINFQNYDDSKKAYNKSYGIKFGEIGVISKDLKLLQRLIKYRHRVVHISPLIGMLNPQEVPPEEPVFSNKKLRDEAVNCFDLFVTKLHEATLTLKRSD